MLLVPAFAPSLSSSSNNFFPPPSLRCLHRNDNSPATARKNPEQSNNSASFPDKPWIRTTEAVRMPTAPWMTSPIILPLSSNNENIKQGENDDALTGRVKGGRSKQAMKKIAQRVVKLRDLDPPVGEIDGGVEEMEIDFPLDMEEREMRRRDGRVPWAAANKMRMVVFGRMKKEKVVTLAERVLSEEELVRLRANARRIRVWVKAKKAGVTQDVVDEIRRTWRNGELTLVKFVQPLNRNMDRAREILEAKTGGLVIWRWKDFLAVYRGQDYMPNSKTTCSSVVTTDSSKMLTSHGFHGNPQDTIAIFAVGFGNKTNESLLPRNGDQQYLSPSIFIETTGSINSIHGSLYEREANRLLDGLGPRFIDWWWPKPLPVDADLLPEIVPNFRPPSRRCPPNVRLNLTDDELTYLRKLARPLPTHFALGKNTKLQGLAAAIIKLWEKSYIAKIAIKRGILCTNNEVMSCELKRLTGGVLILRNKFIIILYRGKDFLPKGVAESIHQREDQLENLQSYEEQARENAIKLFHGSDEMQCTTRNIGTFLEFKDLQANSDTLEEKHSDVNIEMVAEKEKLEKELRKQDHQLSRLKLRLEKSELGLAKLNAAWRPSEQTVDREMLTEEENQAFLNIGLKMDEVIFLGRRGIYDAVIGSIHLHWKHREIVKVITMQTSYSRTMQTARFLEIESGGILISVEKLINRHAIILYRGRNYRPPPMGIFPKNLLTKREALQRSIEIQRRGSLRFFIREREKSVKDLKCKLAKCWKLQRKKQTQ